MKVELSANADVFVKHWTFAIASGVFGRNTLYQHCVGGGGGGGGGASVVIGTEGGPCPWSINYASDVDNTYEKYFPEGTTVTLAKSPPMCVRRDPDTGEKWAAAWLNFTAPNGTVIKYVAVERDTGSGWRIYAAFRNNVVPGSSQSCSVPPDRIQTYIGCP